MFISKSEKTSIIDAIVKLERSLDDLYARVNTLEARELLKRNAPAKKTTKTKTERKKNGL